MMKYKKSETIAKNHFPDENRPAASTPSHELKLRVHGRVTGCRARHNYYHRRRAPRALLGFTAA